MVVVTGLNAAQQVWIDLVLKIALAQVGSWANTLYSHFSHATLYQFAIDIPPFTAQYGSDPPASIRRLFRVDLVDAVSQSDLLVRRLHRLVVHAGAVR